MMRLADIGVRIESGGLGPGVTALLYEIADGVEHLASDGETGAIDLGSLPLSPVDREHLQRMLGTGEVEATLKVDGLSHIRETGIPGVWWIEHRDARGGLIAELIEFTRIPEILCAAVEDLDRGAAVLRARVAGVAAGATEEAS
jgi:hydrogenase-1 operon protein HyaF